MTDHQVIKQWLSDDNADIQIGIMFYAKFSRNKILLSRFSSSPDSAYTRAKLKVELERLLPNIDAKQETLRVKYEGPVQSEKLPPHPDRNTNIKMDPLALEGDTPADDAPVRDASADDAPVGDAPADDAPAGDAPVGDAPEGDAPAGDASAGDAPAGDAPNYPPEIVNLLVKRQSLNNQRQKLSNSLINASTDLERQEIGASIDRLSEEIKTITNQVKEFETSGKLPEESASKASDAPQHQTLENTPDVELLQIRNNLRSSISKLNKKLKSGNMSPSKLEKARVELQEKTQLLKDVEKIIADRAS